MRTLVCAFLAMGLAAAGPVTLETFDRPPPISPSEFAKGLDMARVERVMELVRRTRPVEVKGEDGEARQVPSDLRVSLMVLDNGTGTDASPRHNLYLTMHNVLDEFGVAFAVAPVASVWRYLGVKRIEAGIYRVEATMIAYDLADDLECAERKAHLTIDARRLSSHVRSAPGLGELSSERYLTPITVKAELLGCAQ